MLIDQSFVFTTVRYTIAVLYELLYVTIESGLYHGLFPEPLALPPSNAYGVLPEGIVSEPSSSEVWLLIVLRV